RAVSLLGPREDLRDRLRSELSKAVEWLAKTPPTDNLTWKSQRTQLGAVARHAARLYAALPERETRAWFLMRQRGAEMARAREARVREQKLAGQEVPGPEMAQLEVAKMLEILIISGQRLSMFVEQIAALARSLEKQIGIDTRRRTPNLLLREFV